MRRTPAADDHEDPRGVAPCPRRWRQARHGRHRRRPPGQHHRRRHGGDAALGADRSSLDVLDGMLPVQEDTALAGFLEPEHLVAVPVGGSNVAEPVRAVLSSAEVIETLGESGIPEVAVDAYKQAADTLAVDDPTCGVRWTLLAAIGRVESEPRPLRRRPAAGRRLRHQADPRHPARRAAQRRADPRHRRRRARRRHHLRPGRGADAVHPVDVAVGRGRTATATGGATRTTSSTPPRAPAGYLCAGDADLRDPDASGPGRCAATTTPTSTSGWCCDLAEMYESGAVERLPSIGLPAREPTPPAAGDARPAADGARSGDAAHAGTARAAAPDRPDGGGPPTPRPPTPPPTTSAAAVTAHGAADPGHARTAGTPADVRSPGAGPVHLDDGGRAAARDHSRRHGPARRARGAAGRHPRRAGAIGARPARGRPACRAARGGGLGPGHARSGRRDHRAGAGRSCAGRGRPGYRSSGRVPARRGEPCLPVEPGTGSGDAASGRALRRAARRRVTGAGPRAPRRPAHGGTLGGRVDGRALRREARPSTGESAIRRWPRPRSTITVMRASAAGSTSTSSLPPRALTWS